MSAFKFKMFIMRDIDLMSFLKVIYDTNGIDNLLNFMNKHILPFVQNNFIG